MGTFSRQDETNLMLGCDGVLLIGGAFIICAGFVIYCTAQRLWSLL